ncbi:hypothetical protein M427DRAFT_57092 [Gonapodya prolifera JEL478]|uniref:Phosphotransferase n=1 Tax=Gonapodya prolifera (strain JEL478) TaxID=1344416 RepID=A0A139ADP5_GONPJ|nr:hypothetical protein M427DRAFT_57092 [Gonapodya prolifera JEL478]|eukprot:KXS14942.1 hypothetical protein M427DRAFT_57092 [Gonapodya prolifera JEL478]
MADSMPDVVRRKPDWMAKLEREFTIGKEDLAGIAKDMLAKMEVGLARENTEMKMLASFVRKRPTGHEVGTVYALDFGGTNFRVCQLDLTDDASGYRFHAVKFKIPEELKLAPGEKLFDFFADSVNSFLNQQGITLTAPGAVPDLREQLKKAKLGFTFSFPIQQLALDKGILLQWNKGFNNPGVVGSDVVELLHHAFDRKGIPFRVTALVNDTVGTLLANGYKNPNTTVGAIIGTGTNAAYWESVDRIRKWTGDKSGDMVVNTEWGAFTPQARLLTTYDKRLDDESINPGMQVFEKMISGRYIGEIVRLILVDLHSRGHILTNVPRLPAKLTTPYEFDTEYLSRLAVEQVQTSSPYPIVQQVMAEVGVQVLEDDRRKILEIAELVALRSARISVAGVAALILQQKLTQGTTVAVDGSVYELYPRYKQHMEATLVELLGTVTGPAVTLELGKDGSGIGAAVIAALG